MGNAIEAAGIVIENLSLAFGETEVLKGVNLEIEPGEFFAFLGPSGSGKSTLLRSIAGFGPTPKGRILIGGKDVAGLPPWSRDVGMVFQSYALWPHMTVAQNVGYSLRVAKIPKAERQRRVAAALDLVNMASFGERPPANLSGGQRQRVALARCLVAEPALVLFDEPLANLDVHLRASMEDEFSLFHKRTGTTILYITHDQSEAMALADRIAVLDHGKLMQLDTPHMLYHEPANEMVASFISQGMVLPATVQTAEENGTCQATVLGQKIILRCRKGETARTDARVCCRSEHVKIADPDSPGFDGVVRRVVYQGGAARIEFAPDGEPDRIVHFGMPDPVQLEVGQSARLSFTTGWLIPAPAAT